MLVQEILRAGPHTANVFHGGDGCRIVEAVLHGKPGTGLLAMPTTKSMRVALSARPRARQQTKQLNLFVSVEA